MKLNYKTLLIILVIVSSCSKDDENPSSNLENLNISPSVNADIGSSYTNSKTDIRVDYSLIPSGGNSGDLRDAIAYLDANGDNITDIFMATGEFQLMGEVNSILAINDGTLNFTSSTDEFNDNMPPATHARKSIVSDFNGDNLADIFVFDHGSLGRCFLTEREAFSPLCLY